MGAEGLTAGEVSTLTARLEELGSVGRRGPGLWRFPLTPDYDRAAALVGGWMRAAGLEVRRDPVGNVVGRVAGETERVVAVGSHLDTVRNGGAFDGALGVLGGLAAVSHLLASSGRPRKTLEVIAFTGEEGSRFPTFFLGSRWMTGTLPPEDLLLADADGVTVGAALAAAGQAGAHPPRTGRKDLDAYLELHIEQGPVLEASGRSVAVVSTILGQCEAEVTVTGRADHAGTTPMGLRHDALVEACRLILALREEVMSWPTQTVFTVGRLSVKPGSRNVVPAEVTFSVDLRDSDPAFHRQARERLQAMCLRAGEAGGVGVTWRDLFRTDPVACDPGLGEVLARAARGLGCDPAVLPSGAGHDSMVMAAGPPVGMVFVPSRGGRSHCPEEYTEPEDCARGASVLVEALRELAY